MQKVLHYARQQLPRTKGLFRPILITDIDGVLLRGNQQIPGTYEAVKALQAENIPLACLTNGGGQLQSIKVKKMNDIFGQQLFKADLMFMNHSPIRPHLLKHSKQPGLLLLTGSLNVNSILEDLGIYNYITADELHALSHPEDYPLPTADSQVVSDRVATRLKRSQLPESYDKWGDEINSIFALNDVSPYETALEVIHNVFAQKKRKGQPLPPYFASQNDIVWAGGYHRPRLAFGPFNYMLQEHCQRHNFQLNKCYFGKPQKVAFQFVQNYMKDRFGDGIFFMVGDNPRADIRGANGVNWGSFLTQTGVHQTPDNDHNDPATLVVHNFKQAVDLLLKIKRQSLLS